MGGKKIYKSTKMRQQLSNIVINYIINKTKKRGLIFCVLSLVTTISFCEQTRAQIIPDNSLGNESSIIRQEDGNDVIEGGASRGANLFHSFEEFNVGEGRGVYFTNPTAIENILTRITGNNVSNIFGTLGVLGNANLFLINPNGIVFGPNAILDLSGSFIASSADSIVFDNFEFSASNPQAPPLLTINIPIGLKFRENPGKINAQQTVLEVASGETLALVGGEIEIEGATLIAPAGRIELAGIGENSEITITQNNSSWGLGYEAIESFQDVKLSQFAWVDTSGENGGAIQIQGKNIIFTENATVGYFNSGEQVGGNITITASESVDMSGGATTISVYSEGVGDAGNLTITTKKLLMRDGAYIENSTYGEGKGGNITVKASELVELAGVVTTAEGILPTGIFAQVYEDATGKGGNITIETGKLVLKEGAQIPVTTFGEGNAGNLNVSASESIEILEISKTSPDNFVSSGLFVGVDSGGQGKGGILNLKTAQLIVKNGGQISASTFGAGNGSDVIINAKEIEIIGTSKDGKTPSAIFSQAEEQATGDAGYLTVETEKLSAIDGGIIAVTNRNESQGGNLTITASDFIILTGTGIKTTEGISQKSGIFASAQPAYKADSGELIITSGNAGNLLINTPELIVEKEAIITVDTYGTGNGGNITLNLNQLLIKNGGTVRAGSFVEPGATTQVRGNGGILTVNATESVEIIGTGKIDNEQVKSALSTASEGTGNAGILAINTDNLIIEDGGEITAATASGEGGNINLQISDLISLNNNSSITTTAGGTGNGGNMTIITDFLVGKENSQITANAFLGRGGNINITTQGIFFDPSSKITATSELGIDGEVEINTPDNDPAEGLIDLAEKGVDVEKLISYEGCEMGKKSEFYIIGKGGIPDSPNQPFNSDLEQENWTELPEDLKAQNDSNSPDLNTSSSRKIVPARGWIFNDKGEVVLVGYDPTLTQPFRQIYQINCQGHTSINTEHVPANSKQ